MIWNLPPMRRHPRGHIGRPAGVPNPFEVYLLVICVFQGISVLSGLARPNTIQRALPGTLVIVWALLLLLGGAAAVIGLYWPWDPIDGVIIKRVGLLSAGGGTLAYGAALCLVGSVGYVAAAFYFGFAAACFARAYQVSVALATFRSHLIAIVDTGTSEEDGPGP